MKRFPAIVAVTIRPQTPAELDLFRHQTFAHLGIDRRPKDFPEMTISSHVAAVLPPRGSGVGRHSAPVGAVPSRSSSADADTSSAPSNPFRAS